MCIRPAPRNTPQLSASPTGNWKFSFEVIFLKKGYNPEISVMDRIMRAEKSFTEGIENPKKN
tara:strand:- start:89 stop:274 length:186 start_codon:yes stop_codon:yes gene_type:complete